MKRVTKKQVNQAGADYQTQVRLYGEHDQGAQRAFVKYWTLREQWEKQTGQRFGENPVPPSSRVRARIDNPEFARAAELFEDFTGHQGAAWRKVRVRVPSSALVVGRCDGVLYTTVRDGKTEKYIHKFKAKAAPVLCASPDGKQLFLIGGNFRFTDRGIVDE